MGLIVFIFWLALTNTTHATLFFCRKLSIPFRKQKRKLRIKNVVGDGFTNKEASTKFVSLRCGYQKFLQGCADEQFHRFRSKLTAHFFRRVFEWLGSVSATEIVPSLSLSGRCCDLEHHLVFSWQMARASFGRVWKFDSGADWCFHQCRGASGQCVIGESKCFRGLGTEQSWLDSISEFDCRIVACIVACLGRQNHMYYYMAITQYIHECLF